MSVWFTRSVDILMNILVVLFWCMIAWLYVVSAISQVIENWYKQKEAHYKRLEKGDGELKKYIPHDVHIN
jgi:hypothetical protein